jgi:uncharacterized cupin superfamily protein
MKRIATDSAPVNVGSNYPAPYDEPCQTSRSWRLGDAAGLTQFGVNLTRLPPGRWSSQRHWHASEDEFIYVLQGEVTLVSDTGEETLRSGDCVGFKAGDPDGHHLQNRGAVEAVILEVGTRNPAGDAVHYPDIDLIVPGGSAGYTHRDGTPYPT